MQEESPAQSLTHLRSPLDVAGELAFMVIGAIIFSITITIITISMSWGSAAAGFFLQRGLELEELALWHVVS